MGFAGSLKVNLILSPADVEAIRRQGRFFPMCRFVFLSGFVNDLLDKIPSGHWSIWVCLLILICAYVLRKMGFRIEMRLGSPPEDTEESKRRTGRD